MTQFFNLTLTRASTLAAITLLLGACGKGQQAAAPAVADKPVSAPPVAVVDGGEQILLWRLAGAQMTADELRREIAQRFGLNSRAFAVRDIEELPLKASGKVDYEALAKRDAG